MHSLLGLALSKQNWGRLFWYVCWFGIGFLPPELLGESGVAPWPTLSGTIQYDVHKWWWAATITLGVCLGLTVHWLFDQKLWPSLFFGASVALSAHFLNNKWP